MEKCASSSSSSPAASSSSESLDAGESILQYIVEPGDSRYEKEVTCSPYNLKAWLSYLSAKPLHKHRQRYIIYERALHNLPRSYKLWHAYLTERVRQLRGKPLHDRRHIGLERTFNRALVYMNSMPVIWMLYADFLVAQKRGTAVRKAFDAALQALPVTQHHLLWPKFVSWAGDFGVHKTAQVVNQRFLMFDPSARAFIADEAEKRGDVGEAARHLAACLDRAQGGDGSEGSRHALCMRLVQLAVAHPEEMPETVRVDAIIRACIKQFSDQVASLWCQLATYYVRQGEFEQARDIYEEALHSVALVRDFSLIFDAFVKFEEQVMMALLAEKQEAGNEEGDDGEFDVEVEMRVARLEHLVDKRPLLLNDVLLRQNPHNVEEWHNRVRLARARARTHAGLTATAQSSGEEGEDGLSPDDVASLLKIYAEAVETVNPFKASSGRFSSLWIELSAIYERAGDLEGAREVLARAAERATFKSADELGAVVAARAELEMRQDEFEAALALLRRATRVAGASTGAGDSAPGTKARSKLHRSTRVWVQLLDLEEALSSLDDVRVAYESALELRVLTPQMVLNFTAYLREQRFFDESFSFFERAIAAFQGAYPHCERVWLAYLDSFQERYGETKLERLRELYEEALRGAPAESTALALLYTKFARAEESLGMIRRALAIYDRATRAVKEESRLDAFRLYVRKVEEHLGITKTRPVYERGLEDLPDDAVVALALEFADMEQTLGEVDRARAILKHAAQFADPKFEPSFWGTWRAFEEAHGNEDTFRDMLRVQRSVQISDRFAHPSLQQLQHQAAKSAASAREEEAGNSIEALEKVAFQRASEQTGGSAKRKFES
jgi:pre-mRNA-splicing factor SYF1